METIDTKEQIAENVLVFDGYRESNNIEEQEFYAQRIRLGKIFVCVPKNGRVLFCPSRFAGYKNNTMQKHVAFEEKSGSVTTPRINSVLKSIHQVNNEAEAAYLAHCTELNIKPSAKQRTYWLINAIVSASPHQRVGGESGFPDEISGYFEGATKQVYVNAYERNPEARKACIEYYGCACTVCGFDFETRYGAVGRGFIHVHHLMPLAVRNAEYEVNPITDLRPVCPNCHAMLHKSDPPFSVMEMQELIK